MWNLRKKANKQRGKKESQTKKQTLNYRELMVTRREVGGWVKQVMGTKKCTRDEHQGIYGSLKHYIIHLKLILHCMVTGI